MPKKSGTIGVNVDPVQVIMAARVVFAAFRRLNRSRHSIEVNSTFCQVGFMNKKGVVGGVFLLGGFKDIKDFPETIVVENSLEDCIEQMDRLHRYPGHRSAWESRVLWQKMHGGAIRTPSGITFSCSGPVEDKWSEAMAVVIAGIVEKKPFNHVAITINPLVSVLKTEIAKFQQTH